MGANPATQPPVPFTVEVNSTADRAVALCNGPLTAENTAILKDNVKPLITSGRHIQIDMAGVSYVDSAGLGTIVSLYMSARAVHCELKLIRFNEQVRNLLHITNLLWLLE